MLDVESEVSMFDALVKQTSGFREEQVAHYGIGHLDILSSACLVPGGGFEYSINGKSQSFETTDHLNAFLVHGTSGNVEPWVKGGVLGSFVQTFGDDAGGDMVAKHGHMVGIIPQLIIKNCRRDLRSSHGITIRESTGITTTTADDPNMQYCFWRPMLLAKFSVAGPAKDALMGTGALYLIDNDSSSTEWSGKISYPGNHNDKCTCKSSVTNGKNKKAGCPISKVNCFLQINLFEPFLALISMNVDPGQC